MNLYADLFLTFAKIGAFTFGGGYAMLPMFQRELAEKHGWVTNEEILDYYAVAQCTPGVIAVNTATFVGSKLRGWRGGAAATLGVTTPAVIIITVIALFLQHFAEYPVVKHAFAGIGVAVTVLITGAVIKLWKNNIKGLFSFALFAAGLAVSVLTNWSPVWVVIAAALAGILSEKWGKAK